MMAGVDGKPVERLRLYPDPTGDIGRVDFYESSVPHPETGEPLVSIVALNGGVRITREQVVELRDWLTEWLGASA